MVDLPIHKVKDGQCYRVGVGLVVDSSLGQFSEGGFEHLEAYLVNLDIFDEIAKSIFTVIGRHLERLQQISSVSVRLKHVERMIQ